MIKIKKIESESGFTLIELLVVIGIIAILATIGAINFSSARAKARDAKRVADIKQIQSAIEVEAAGSSAGLYPSEATSDLPADILTLSPPRTSDRYCYVTDAGLTSYTVAAIGIENVDVANSDGPVDAVGGNGVGDGIILSTGAACDNIDCSAAVAGNGTYCLAGTTAE